MNNNPIGIFDSGIGGLTVVKEIIRVLPDENIVYLGDTARVPYGTRSKEVITKFALELVNFLLKREVKFLVVACNTISATCLNEIIKVSPVPVLGVVDPTIEFAVGMTKNKKVGVIGTAGTINSRAYDQRILQGNAKIKVSSVACPLFVPIAEEGLADHQVARLIATDYLKDLRNNGIDTLILACTHYPLMRKIIEETMGSEVVLIDSAKPTAKKLKQVLKENNLLSKKKNPKYEFYVTDAPERVLKVASRFFGNVLNGYLKKITLPIL
ncbi:glutamate racemase [Candidatus Daviesbacteria bacterium]|nr:glutamate racemase [Candidatus Daviesbacteria bacterium]